MIQFTETKMVFIRVRISSVALMVFLLCCVNCTSPGILSTELASNQHYYSMATNVSDDAGHLLMPIWAYKSAASYLIFISVMGSILNFIVVVALLSDQQKMTPLNLMLLNLAFCDGIIAGVGTPISMMAAFQSGWRFGKEVCVAYAMIISTTGIGSITTLSALAMLRWKLVVQKYIHPSHRINFPFANPGARMERHQAALLLTLIWSYSLAVTCPPLFGWGHYDLVAAHISCSVSWESKKYNNQLYIMYVFITGLLIPMAAIVASYGNILRSVRNWKAEMTSKTEANPQPMPQLLHGTQRNTSWQSDAAEKRSTVMVAVMIAAFLIAWTPYSVLALIETFTGENDGNSSVAPVLATVPSLFAKTSAVFNPIIYGFFNTQFKLTWDKFSLRFLHRSSRPDSANQHSQPVQYLNSSAGLAIRQKKYDSKC